MKWDIQPEIWDVNVELKVKPLDKKKDDEEPQKQESNDLDPRGKKKGGAAKPSKTPKTPRLPAPAAKASLPAPKRAGLPGATKNSAFSVDKAGKVQEVFDDVDVSKLKKVKGFESTPKDITKGLPESKTLSKAGEEIIGHAEVVKEEGKFAKTAGKTTEGLKSLSKNSSITKGLEAIKTIGKGDEIAGILGMAKTASKAAPILAAGAAVVDVGMSGYDQFQRGPSKGQQEISGSTNFLKQGFQRVGAGIKEGASVTYGEINKDLGKSVQETKEAYKSGTGWDKAKTTGSLGVGMLTNTFRMAFSPVEVGTRASVDTFQGYKRNNSFVKNPISKNEAAKMDFSSLERNNDTTKTKDRELEKVR